MYSTVYANTIPQNLTAVFSGKTGYETTTNITENNQFTSKTYVDSNFYNNSTPLNSIVAPSANLNINN